jgi:hypothetical protein
MRYEFLIETYETERMKVISASTSVAIVGCLRRSGQHSEATRPRFHASGTLACLLSARLLTGSTGSGGDFRCRPCRVLYVSQLR